MKYDLEKLLQVIKLALSDESVAFEFVTNELSFATKSSLKVRNFAKLSGIVLKDEPPLLDLDSPNIILSNLLAPLGAYQSTIDLRLQVIEEVMKYYELGRYGNKVDKEAIRSFCRERKITNLIHFTKVQNVRSILDIGLNSKDYNSEISKRHVINDMGRFDYRTHMISLSVSYPNDKMFYKYRQVNTEQEWAVICLSPSILWELECLFCPTNAASSSISSVNNEILSGSQALERLFSKQADNSRLCYPCDSQAEVLVSSHIPSRYIQSIYVENETDALCGLNPKPIVNPFYFHNREFALDNRSL
ncbi:DarT ssDNA thymidine ADP-ribosyltransferase family protein [Aliivibrio salmonicida]|uniref:DarT ssDNA thymidine ADP-ribosyltransferase family protein n=1 Tax=Aliivibrio salmonicida TaxID=40269 RepID=UPI003D09FBD9